MRSHFSQFSPTFCGFESQEVHDSENLLSEVDAALGDGDSTGPKEKTSTDCIHSLKDDPETLLFLSLS